MDAAEVDVPGWTVSDSEWAAFCASCVADGYDDPASSAAEPSPESWPGSLATGPDDVLEPNALRDRMFWLSHSVDELLSTVQREAHRSDPGQVVEALRAIELVRRRLPAPEHVLLAEIDQRSMHESYAQPSAAKLISSELRLAPGEATARMTAARELGPRVALDGQPLAPRLELVAEAQALGELSERQAAVITRTMRDLPAWTATEAAADLTAASDGSADQVGTVRDQTELRLVGLAETLDPIELAHAARRVLDHLDPDGREPVDQAARRRRGLTLFRRPDGSYRLHGELDHGCGATWSAVLDACSKPVPAVDGVQDLRSPAQRRHDGFADAGAALLRTDVLPDSGGVPATVIVTVDADVLAERTGDAHTAHGDPWPVADMLDALGDRAQWITVFNSSTDGVLAYGLDRRFATPAMTCALIARDHGCSFPDCDRPATWCERHHIIPVVPRKPGDAPGRTDLTNLTLLCGWHHRMFESLGWECLMIDGRPRWRPPAHLDPDRRPRRNTHWDLARVPPPGMGRPRAAFADPPLA